MKVACTMTVAAPLLSNSKVRGAGQSMRQPPFASTLSNRGAATASGQDVVDDMASDVGEAEVSSLVAVGEPLVVDPQ
jgi:hypothetical protein